MNDWTVYHPDGEELGLTPRRFDSEFMARAVAARWNKNVPGHVVIPPEDTVGRPTCCEDGDPTPSSKSRRP